MLQLIWKPLARSQAQQDVIWLLSLLDRELTRSAPVTRIASAFAKSGARKTQAARIVKIFMAPSSGEVLWIGTFPLARPLGNLPATLYASENRSFRSLDDI